MGLATFGGIPLGSCYYGLEKFIEMNICLLTRYFDLRNHGLGRVSMEVRDGLVRKGHKVSTISTDGNSLYSYFLYTSMGIPLRLLGKNFDVYHAITPMEGMWLPKDKSVVTFHDLFQITDRDKLGSGIGYSKWKNLVGTKYFEFVVNVAKRCRRVVAVSEKTKEDLVKFLGVPESKIRVIRSGIYPQLEPEPKSDNKFRIGYMGQLDRRKRVNILIDAFKKSKLDELVLAGGGVDEEPLRTLAGGDKRIKFVGIITEKHEDFYNSLDVFILPTWLEGYGLPIVEAMACKKPVIVLGDAKIPWEVKRRCIIVDKLDYVLGNKEYLERICKGVDIEDNYKWAKSHTWEKTVDEYIKVYEEVIE